MIWCICNGLGLVWAYIYMHGSSTWFYFLVLASYVLLHFLDVSCSYKICSTLVPFEMLDGLHKWRSSFALQI